ncbi:MAG: hypothetical protein VW549_05815, partial [Methylophilaceae bacterium]
NKLIFNCNPASASELEVKNVIDFVRGKDVYFEDDAYGWQRQSFLGDTFHSDLVYVVAHSSSISTANKYSEAYFRYQNKYQDFKDKWKDREERLYVGANDGMLHAFDKNLNHMWSFIPP